MTDDTRVDMLQPVLKKYNNTKHSTTNMTPHEAKKKDNHVEVWLNIRSKANFNRMYPPLKVGDSVRTYIKPHTFKKKVILHHGRKKYIKSHILKIISI